MPDTVWLLDVDGVINVPGSDWDDLTRSRAGRLTVHWSPTLAARIRAVAEQASVCWCSTWCYYPPQLAALEDLFGLPALGWACGSIDMDVSAWKLAAARSMLLVEGRRLVWTDDDETPEPGPLFDELTADGRALLIRPDSRRGLRPEHMDAIEAFCRTEAAV